ncbi:hypothetical protein MHBO_001912 [Bonamia ostreae]|uniref:Uncharacterized protein n=1 Tax=Bonamia ostreae TaxID=126728 RepID=A0ABV2AKM7_9EUKA
MKNSALKKLGPPLRVKTDVDSFGELNSAKKTTTQLFQKNKEISIKDYSQKRNYDASEKRRDRSLENNKNEIILKTPILSQPKSALKLITNKLEKSKMPLKSIKTTNRKIDFEQNLKNSRERAKSPNYFNRKKVNFLKLETEIRIKKPVNKLSPQKEARASASVAQPTSSTGRSKKRSRERSMTLQTLMGISSRNIVKKTFENGKTIFVFVVRGQNYVAKTQIGIGGYSCVYRVIIFKLKFRIFVFGYFSFNDQIDI